MRIKFLLAILLSISLITAMSVIGLKNSSGVTTPAETPATPMQQSWISIEMNAIKPQAKNLNPEVLKLGLTAYEHTRQDNLTTSPLLAIVDYSLPSTHQRLWVINTETKKVLFDTWVAQGKNSGSGIEATSFSNVPGTLKSCLGIFLTTTEYTGKHGEELHIKGLDVGFNDNAYKREIVIHGAEYVSAKIAASGKLGHSWGCLAVSQKIIVPLVNTLKGGAVIISYYPDQNWLNHSVFLK